MARAVAAGASKAKVVAVGGFGKGGAHWGCGDGAVEAGDEEEGDRGHTATRRRAREEVRRR